MPGSHLAQPGTPRLWPWTKCEKDCAPGNRGYILPLPEKVNVRPKRTVFSIFAVVLVVGIRMPAPAAQGQRIFCVGMFDRSSAEFAGGKPTKSVNFVVGQSNPSTDWVCGATSRVDIK
jgi:Polysaccharide lyase family 4, domain III